MPTLEDRDEVDAERSMELANEIALRYANEDDGVLLTASLIVIAMTLNRNAQSRDHLALGVNLASGQLNGFCSDFWNSRRAD